MNIKILMMIRLLGAVLLYLITFFLLKTTVNAQVPERKALIGILVKMDGTNIRVDSVLLPSTANDAGVKKNDILISLNSKSFKTVQEYYNEAGSVRSKDNVVFDLMRNGKQLKLNAKAIAKPFAELPDTKVVYNWLNTGECKLRMISYYPTKGTKFPTILLIPGYNCGSVEGFATSYNGKIIKEWVNHGYAVVTVEKSGIGDSYGCIPCGEVDLATDIDYFTKAYVFMQTFDFVDKENLFLWGHSMGGVIAPEISKIFNPRGVLVFATVFRPWSEFLLEMHRVQYPLDGKSYTETENRVRIIQKIYYEFFVEKKTPEELYKNPAYKEVIESEDIYKKGSNDMWGRHWRFWQQIDSLNLADSWAKTKCPVLSIYGEADFIQCSALESFLIADAVNKSHPGNGTNVHIPDIDHLMVRNANMEEAHKHFGDRDYMLNNFNPKIAEITIKWMDEIRSKPN